MADPDPSALALEITGLRYSYPGAARPVVDVPSLTLAAGGRMLLTGASGRGKSTLLHLVAGLATPDAGTVRVAGVDVHALRGAQRDLFRGRTIGMVFQTFHLLPGFSALENVMAPMHIARLPRDAHETRARELLDRLGIERPSALPEELSVGQQQRVAVARALACTPALVLADEPTASLDPETARVAIDLLQETCGEIGAALLCVSHDPSLTERFDVRRSLDEQPAPQETSA